jgi:hypothetical protein
MALTLEVSHVSIGWLNEVAPENILPILVTAVVFQSSIGWFYKIALLNIFLIDR